MKYLFLLFLLSTTILSNLSGQPSPPATGGKITGKVIDGKENTALEFATISIYTNDSSLVTGGITAADGTFSIDVKTGNYYAIIQFISYRQKEYFNIVIDTRNKVYDLGNILLEPETTYLNAVSVSAEKSEMVIHLDKKVFNVGKDLSNTGKSALEIMDNIPSVTVDLDGNISLRGSQSLQILVNGKPSGMVNAGNTDALRNMQGNMIERIEVITNPSARYEAEGMAGIINIVLKKEQEKGINGSFEATAGYPHQYSLGANVNFRREKINYFLNYNIRYGERPGSGYSNQYFNLSDTSYMTKLDRDRLRTGLSNRIRGGADYFINSKNTLTGAFLLGYDDQFNTTNLWYYDYTSSEELLATSHRLDEESEDQFDIEGSLLYEKIFDTKEHKFTAFAQYIDDSETEKSTIGETIIPSNEASTSDNITQQVYNNESEQNILLQADYINPFGNDGKFEAGYRSEFRTIKNPYYVDEINEDGEPVRIPEYSNDFLYTENVYAAYAQAGNTFNRFSIQAGLRVEISDVRTHLKETDEKNNRFYTNLFPTLHTTFQFDKKNSMQLSYSRRIHRPHFRMLNPFHSYTDSRNIRTGNPNLEPEFTHSLETGYLLKLDKFDFYSGIYYRFTKGVIERVSVVDDSTGITYMMPLNLAERQSFGVEANTSLDFFKWWTLSTDINFFRFITNGEFEGEDLHSDDYSWNTRINSRMRFPKNFDFQTIFFYRAPTETTQGTRKAFYMLNMAVSKDILKGKGTLTFNVRDVLNSRKFRFIYDQPDLYSESEFRWSERSYTLTFLYLLNQKKKPGKGNRGQNGNGGDFSGDEMDF